MIDATAPEAVSHTGRKTFRSTKEAEIYRDLAAGEISIRTTLPELTTRYGSDPWHHYREALRDYGYDHGCLVMVDDENDGRYVAMMEHFGRDISCEEARDHFSRALVGYLEQARAADKASLPDNVVRLDVQKRTRYSVYRLPFGDYSKDKQPFFEQRAEFMWEAFIMTSGG